MEKVKSISETLNASVNDVLNDCLAYENKEAVIVLCQMKDGSQLFASKSISHMQKAFLIAFADSIIKQWFHESE